MELTYAKRLRTIRRLDSRLTAQRHAR